MLTDAIDRIRKHLTGIHTLADIYNRVPSVSDVVIYPVAILAGTAEITDDGASPPYYADAGKEDGTGKTADTDPNIHWEQCISHFEREGTINTVSIFLELRWEHKISGGGTAYSKIQMSGDGTGGTWVDVTDDIVETNAAYQSKTRIGVGLFLPTIVAGASKLCFRLISWEPAGGAANTSSAKIRSDSYTRITYRKS